MNKIYNEFNEKYNSYGWIADKNIDEVIIINSIQLNDINKVDELISDYYTEEFINKNISVYKMFENSNLENLPSIGTLFYKYFIERDHIIQNALKDFLSQNYNTCIVLLLTVIDGITKDIDKKYGFFSRYIKQNLKLTNDTYFDVDKISKNSLQEIHKLLYQSRNNTNNLEITIPYRNGILHGRDLNYGNKIVASKCWNILFALFYFGKNNNLNAFEKDEEKNTKPLTIEEIKKQIPSDFQSFIEQFKECLIDEKKRYKLIYMDKAPSNKHSKNRRIDDMKRYFDNEFEKISIIDFKIISSENISQNLVNYFIEILFNKDGINNIKNKYIQFEYSNTDNKLLNINNNNGYWKTDLANLLSNLTII